MMPADAHTSKKFTRMCLHVLFTFLLVLLHKRVNFLLVWASAGIIEAIYLF